MMKSKLLMSMVAVVISAGLVWSSSARLNSRHNYDPCRLLGYFGEHGVLEDFTCIGDCGGAEPPCQLEVTNGDIDDPPFRVACQCDGEWVGGGIVCQAEIEIGPGDTIQGFTCYVNCYGVGCLIPWGNTNTWVALCPCDV